jgi:WD40 repeat protein
VSKLRGHTENVRALAINPGANLLLSGSSDGTLKLWDLGMQRCVQTYVVHTDTVSAVLACAASGEADWSMAITGSRDGRVFRTHLATRTAELLVQQAPPVSAMAYDAQTSRLWVSSPHNGSVSCYQVPREAPAPAGRGPPGSGASFAAPSRVRPAAGSAASGQFGRSSVDVLRAQTPAATAPIAVLPGLHPIVLHRVRAWLCWQPG